MDETFQEELSEKWLILVMERALQVALAPEERRCQVGLLITDDETVRELNGEYRGLDEVTDVLSFSADHPGHWEGDDEAPQDRYLGPDESTPNPFVLPPDQLPPLGEVIVSYPQTRRQAQAGKQPVERELALLIVHGVLHLVGHDHLAADEQDQMQAKEQTALHAIFKLGTG